MLVEKGDVTFELPKRKLNAIEGNPRINNFYQDAFEAASGGHISAEEWLLYQDYAKYLLSHLGRT